ncbi:MAG TPA: hypothetical protein VHD56_10945 [Tepidisphaeraceae bacterium]|nr:hypothetical protein [Tepidisphaeraceae bacterium]
MQWTELKGKVLAIRELVRCRLSHRSALGYLPEVLVSSDKVIDYRSVAAVPTGRVATQLVLVVTLLVPASYVTFRVLRNHQLSLPDPFNNPYTGWSTAVMYTFFALVFVDFVLLAILRRRVARASLYLGCLVVFASGAYMAWLFIGMLRFIYP